MCRTKIKKCNTVALVVMSCDHRSLRVRRWRGWAEKCRRFLFFELVWIGIPKSKKRWMSRDVFKSYSPYQKNKNPIPFPRYPASLFLQRYRWVRNAVQNRGIHCGPTWWDPHRWFFFFAFTAYSKVLPYQESVHRKIYHCNNITIESCRASVS